MDYRTVKNCGELGIEFRNMDSDGARVARDLLGHLFHHVVVRSGKYYRKTGDHIFTYRERQLHSVICPSIADITPSYVIEHPLTRKPAGEEEFQGHADYWIIYRNYTFLMELKHSYFAFQRADNPRQSLIAKFNSAMQQLKSIRTDERRNLTMNKGLIRVALEAIVFYKGSKNEITINELRNQDFKDSFDRLMGNRDLRNKVNVGALWVLNENIVEPFPLTNSSYEIYPALGFIGNILETTK